MSLEPYSKQICVGVLLALWFALDALKIADPQLRYAIMGLIGSIAGWHVLNNLPGTSKTPPQP